MASFYKDGKTWTVTWRFRPQRRQYAYGIKSESLASKAAAKRTLEEQLHQAGLHTPDTQAGKFAAHAMVAIEDHLKAFEKAIVAKGKTKQHAQQQAAHVRRLCKLARVRRIDRLEADPIQAAAKRIIDDEKRSPRTANAALQAAHQFGEWLRKSGRWQHNLLIDFERFNEEEDQRRLRRELSEPELDYLIRHVEEHGRRRSGVNGVDRARLYQTALYTGFRQAACLSLEKKDFHVDPKMTRPFVGLWAGANKKRRRREQPIPRDFAAVLHAWLEGKAAGKVWRPSEHAHKELWMLRDMEAARAAWVAEASAGKAREGREKSDFLHYRDSHGRFADFHGWRHTGISRVVRVAGLKAGQVWADHSSPVITARYAHMNLLDEAKSLEALPPVARPEEKDGEKRKKA